MVHSLALISVIVLLIVATGPATAGPIQGVAFADTMRVDRTLFTLNGVASYSKFGIHVLVAGLWLEHPEHDPEKVLRDDGPRRYVTHFLREVTSKRVCKAWRDGLTANSPRASAVVKQQFQTLCGWTHDFHAGDEIAVTYFPGRGSVVEVDGARVGEIPGKAFADAYFACAIGPKPGLGKAFKKALLKE
jgi:hypothetical protein